MVSVGYREIADDIRAQIQDGRLAYGQRLDGVRAIAHRYGVTQGTVASALKRLADEGWVVVQPSSGTHVAAAAPEGRPTLADLARDVAELKAWRERHEAEHG